MCNVRRAVRNSTTQLKDLKIVGAPMIASVKLFRADSTDISSNRCIQGESARQSDLVGHLL